MIERKKTDPFNTGQYAEEEKSENMDKIANRSRIRSANKMRSGAGVDGHDPLRESLMAASPSIYRASHKASPPTDHNRWSHSSSVSPRGAHYNPAGSFGRTARTGAGHGVYSYGGNRHSASPSNAIGSPTGHRGDNALPGHQNSRHGQNAVPGHQDTRGGHNAVGSPPNRYGENALAGRFRPSFGKPHGHRV